MTDTSAFMNTVLYTYPATGMAYTGDPTKAMDSTTDGSGVSFQVTEDCDLTHGNIICVSVTGTSPFYKFQIWPMQTHGNGVPDESGTVLAETAAFQCTADLMKVAFTSPYSATQGQILCLVMVHASGTVDGSNFATVEQTNGRWSYHTGTNVYLNRSSSTWGNNGTYYPAMVVTTNKSYDIGGAMNYGSAGYTTSTAGHIFAQKFTMPADKLLELHVIGFRFAGDMINGSDIVDVGAWGADGAALIDLQTIDADTGGGQSNQFGFYLGEAEVYFAETLTMVSGGTYYIGAKCVSGTFGLQLLTMGADFTAMQRGYPGAGWCQASKWEGSSWNDDWASPNTPGRLMVSPILSDMHGVAGEGEGGGAGGGGEGEGEGEGAGGSGSSGVTPTFNPPVLPTVGSTDVQMILSDAVEMHKGYDQVRPLNLRPVRRVGLAFINISDEDRDYIVSFMNGLKGRVGPFYWTSYDKTPEPTGITPVLSQVSGGSLGASTIYVAFTWHDATHGETTISAATSLAVSASNYLKVEVPPIPNGVAGFRVYAGTSTLYLQDTVTSGRSWTQSAALLTAATAPTTNTLTPQLKWLVEGQIEAAKTGPTLNSVNVNLIEQII